MRENCSDISDFDKIKAVECSTDDRATATGLSYGKQNSYNFPRFPPTLRRMDTVYLYIGRTAPKSVKDNVADSVINKLKEMK